MDTAKEDDDAEDIVEEDAAELENIQKDIESALEHVRDIGRETAQDMKTHLKKVWSEENNGGEPTKEQAEAVLYHLKHLIMGVVPVESEDEQEEEEYKPSQIEQEEASAETEADHTAQKEEISFDFENQVAVSEEQLEKLVAKFTEQKGRSPTSEEMDALVESFKTPLTEANLEEEGQDEDYSPPAEEPAAEEDVELEEDKSLETEEPADAMDCEEEEEEEVPPVDEQSNAFKYMKELEEGPDDEEEVEETAEEPTKIQQKAMMEAAPTVVA